MERVSIASQGETTSLTSIAGEESQTILDYFARNGAPCPPDANPAEHIIDVVQGGTGNMDWVEVWKQSDERRRALETLESLNHSSLSVDAEDTADYASSHWFQFKMVSKRLSIQIWRSPVSFTDTLTGLR